METIKTYSKVAYPVGTILTEEETNKSYEVLACHAMFLMTGGEKTGFGLELKELEVLQ